MWTAAWAEPFEGTHQHSFLFVYQNKNGSVGVNPDGMPVSRRVLMAKVNFVENLLNRNR
jgi:hypothetical protein